MRWVLGLVAGGLLGGALALGIGLGLPSITPISQREGAYAMGVVFVWTPLGMVLGAICGLIWAARRRRRA